MSELHGVIIKIWRRHLSIVDTGNYEAPFRAGCQPFFVLTGCLLLLHTPALQPFLVPTGVLHFPPGYRHHILITPCMVTSEQKRNMCRGESFSSALSNKEDKPAYPLTYQPSLHTSKQRTHSNKGDTKHKLMAMLVAFTEGINRTWNGSSMGCNRMSGFGMVNGYRSKSWSVPRFCLNGTSRNGHMVKETFMAFLQSIWTYLQQGDTIANRSVRIVSLPQPLWFFYWYKLSECNWREKILPNLRAYFSKKKIIFL